MRRRRLLTYLAAAATPLLVAGFGFGAGGITGSKHDFSAKSWSDNEICKPCHTPHNAIAPELTGRIWAHELSTATYTLHGSSVTGLGTRLDNTRAGGQADMDSATRLCLSCHDGSVALDSFMGKTGPVTGNTIGQEYPAGGGDLGTDLSNDHPVGLSHVYKEETKHGSYSYKPIADAKAAGIRFVTQSTTRTYVDQDGATVTKANESISCISCHDVHNGAGFTTGLLRMDNAASSMCLACHNK
jgi:predicted CXXCH cytochrome family protein